MFFFTRNFINSVLISGFHPLFLDVLLVGFLNDVNFSIHEIAYFFLFKKISRVLLDIPFGFIFDKLGYKVCFFISKISKLFAIILIFKYHSYQLALIGFVLQGMSEAALFGKAETYLFNYYILRSYV